MTECGICYDDFDSNNIVHLWINNEKTKSNYCITCTNYMLNNNFEKYINDIGKADCEKSLSNALSSPIPINLTIDTLKKSTQIDYIENLDKSLALSLEKRIQIKSRRMKGINPLERRLAAIKEILSNYENIIFTFL